MTYDSTYGISRFLETSLEYMMNTATAAVVEEKMEPVSRTEATRPLVVTGQYLFDNFVRSGEEQITKMGMIRHLSDTADALQIKGACDAMVKIAVEIDYPQGKPKGADRKAKEQSAMNCRTIIQNAWGAMKYARTALNELGYDARTGYQDMRVLAKKALDTSGVNWKGEPLLSDKDKEVKRLQREQKAETQALVDVQKDNPRLTNESLAEWQQRTLELAYDAMEKAREDSITERVTKAVEALTAKYGDNELFRIAEALFNHLGLEVNQPEPEVAETV